MGNSFEKDLRAAPPAVPPITLDTFTRDLVALSETGLPPSQRSQTRRQDGEQRARCCQGLPCLVRFPRPPGAARHVRLVAMTNRYAAAVFACLSVWVACGGESDDIASVESGVYAIESWSLNEQGCDAEGPSILERRVQSHVLIAHVAASDEELIAVQPCLDPEDCLAAFDDLRPSSSPYGELTGGNRADGFEGWREGSTATGDICRFWAEAATLITDAGVALFERRTQYVDTARTGLFCGFSGGPNGRDAPCRELELLTATRVSELP
jgi:hypothetical protein